MEQRAHRAKQLEDNLRKARLKLAQTQKQQFHESYAKAKKAEEEDDRTLLENALSFKSSLENVKILISFYCRLMSGCQSSNKPGRTI